MKRKCFNIFQKYASIEEVVIPPKQDKRRKRFEFTRLTNVNYEKLFATKLDNIIIGSQKLGANLQKHNKVVFASHQQKQQENRKPSKEVNHLQKLNAMQKPYGTHVSYAGVVKK